jgi:hypothetical protein
MTVKPAPTGVLLVRLWVEGDPATGLRARITRTEDIEGGERVTTTAGTVEDVVVTVRRWLEDMTTGPDQTPGREVTGL